MPASAYGLPASLKGVYGKLEAYIGCLCLVLALARFLELRGGEWSGQPSELYLQLESLHKLNRVGPSRDVIDSYRIVVNVVNAVNVSSS